VWFFPLPSHRPAPYRLELAWSKGPFRLIHGFLLEFPCSLFSFCLRLSGEPNGSSCVFRDLRRHFFFFPLYPLPFLFPPFWTRGKFGDTGGDAAFPLPACATKSAFLPMGPDTPPDQACWIGVIMSTIHPPSPILPSCTFPTELLPKAALVFHVVAGPPLVCLIFRRCGFVFFFSYPFFSQPAFSELLTLASPRNPQLCFIPVLVLTNPSGLFFLRLVIGGLLSHLFLLSGHFFLD